jgi:hypothetical protein
VLSKNKNILLIGQQNPGMIRGLDIKDPLSEVNLLLTKKQFVQ